METVLQFLPQKTAAQVQLIPQEQLKSVEEIRLRLNRPLEITINSKPHFLPYIVEKDDAIHLLNKLSKFSLYTIEEELRRGYITIAGGHRVGIAGKVIIEDGAVKSISDISSFNIRIAREKIGIAEQLIPAIYNKSWSHTIIVGPPQTGKTTLLRDIARIISTGVESKNIRPLKVGIVDERSEIAGSVNGVPQLTFGPRLDVLDACPKAEGMMMLIRSMSPDVLIVDEIGRNEDADAIMEAVNAGVTLIATAHGSSYEDILKRPTIKRIIDQAVFERFVELTRQDRPCIVKNIKDKDGKVIKGKVGVF